jgi:uncharacterized protein YbaR (Trm112 family)
MPDMNNANMIDAELLSRLACPLTRTPLRIDRERQELISDAAGLAFPIRDGVPVLVVSQARILKG